VAILGGMILLKQARLFMIFMPFFTGIASRDCVVLSKSHLRCSLSLDIPSL